MELAIPGIALGFLYMISNQSKTKIKDVNGNNAEAFTGKTDLPNVDIPNRNYPGEYPIVSQDTDLTSQLSTTNHYHNAGGAYTDKYFNPSLKHQPSAAGPSYYSLTGDKVNSNYFEHNNMVPFFGSHLRSRVADENSNESILDSYSGSGSQATKKKEQAPMFSPLENMQWAHGAPNESDFYQSRVNPSMRMANVKPFTEETVAPGLGLGYTTQGAGGFNSGMMARESWMEKTADQMRVDNKPKATGLGLYGHEGPANSHIKQNATYEQMGVMEKHLPDQSFELGQDRWFTTTGGEKGQTMRSMPIDRYVARPETATSYSGIAGAQNSAAYMTGEYMPSTNQQLGEVPWAVANAQGRNFASEADYGIKSKMAYPNNRSSSKQDSYFGAVSGSLGAAIAPLLDMLRPSRKENVIGTLRPYQNPGTTVPQSYIFNPADKLGTTIRETTENSKFHLNVNANQNGGGYQVSQQQPVDTYRQETSDFYYGGVASAGAGSRKTTSYESGYNQRNNDIKSSTIDGYMVQGNMSLLNSDVNVRQRTRDDFLKNDRPITGMKTYQSPEISNMGQLAGKDNSLYSNIQMDRTNPDIMDSLKSNPYVVDYRKAL